jgi:hypothetical protein
MSLNLAEENIKLNSYIDQLLDENKKLKNIIKNNEDYLIKRKEYNISKIYINLKDDNDHLKKELDKKNDNCIKEKQALRNEIEDLKKLLNGEHEHKKRKTISTSTC